MSSFLFLLATVLVAADATVVSWLYSGNGLQDKAFTQNVVFTSPVDSAVLCGDLCNQHKSCETFTFEQDLCRGHAVEMTPDTPYVFAAGARSFSKSNNSLGEMSCPKQKREGSQSGVVTIYPDYSTPLQVYCDQDTDGGGWTVFQRRLDGSVDFNRNWTEYENGFGALTGNFWLGLDALHMLTSRQRYELRVDLMKWDNTTGYATYSDFTISDSSDNYRLNYGSFIEGNAEDSLLHHRNHQFSTWDRDNDRWDGNCAQLYRGGWWFTNCAYSSLNGEYKPNSTVENRRGLYWQGFGGTNYSHHFSEMKIREA